MNAPFQQPLARKDAGYATLGMVAKLLAVIVATFVFAAFSRTPTHPQASEHPPSASASVKTPGQ